MITDNCNVNEPHKRKYLLKNRTNRAQNASKTLQSRARQPPPTVANAMRKSESSTSETERARVRLGRQPSWTHALFCRSLLAWDVRCSFHALGMHTSSAWCVKCTPAYFKDDDNPAAIYVLLFPDRCLLLCTCCCARTQVPLGSRVHS